MSHLVRPFLPRRAAVPLLLVFAVLANAVPVTAQTWPKRPLTMVVPYAPGGSTDLVARLIAPGLAAALGQPVLLENMAGVGGIAGVLHESPRRHPMAICLYSATSARMLRTSSCLPIRLTTRWWSLCRPLY